LILHVRERGRASPPLLYKSNPNLRLNLNNLLSLLTPGELAGGPARTGRTSHVRAAFLVPAFLLMDQLHRGLSRSPLRLEAPNSGGIQKTFFLSSFLRKRTLCTKTSYQALLFLNSLMSFCYLLLLITVFVCVCVRACVRVLSVFFDFFL